MCLTCFNLYFMLFPPVPSLNFSPTLHFRSFQSTQSIFILISMYSIFQMTYFEEDRSLQSEVEQQFGMNCESCNLPVKVLTHKFNYFRLWRLPASTGGSIPQASRSESFLFELLTMANTKGCKTKEGFSRQRSEANIF